MLCKKPSRKAQDIKTPLETEESRWLVAPTRSPSGQHLFPLRLQAAALRTMSATFIVSCFLNADLVFRVFATGSCHGDSTARRTAKVSVRCPPLMETNWLRMPLRFEVGFGARFGLVLVAVLLLLGKEILIVL